MVGDELCIERPCACRSSIMKIPPVPDKPKTFKFPQRSFGQKNPVKWFTNRKWLHYDEANNLAYCNVAYRDGKLNSSNLDQAFILNGFSNWTTVTVAFKTQFF